MYNIYTMTHMPGGQEVVPLPDGANVPVQSWNTLSQNPAGVDFRVLCETCPFLDPDTGGCKKDEQNNKGTEYNITNSNSWPTMRMSLDGMMKSYEQARRALEQNSSLRQHPEGGVLSVDDVLKINDEDSKEQRRKLLLTRLAVWSNPVGWAVNAGRYLYEYSYYGNFGRKGFVGQAKERVEKSTEYLSVRGTIIGVAVLSQIVRLNCARVNRARVDNANLASQINNGQIWAIGSDELIHPDDLR